MMVGIGSGVGSGHMITVRLPFDGSRDARPWRRSGSSEVAFVRSAPRRAPADPSHPRVVVSTLCAGSIRRRRLVRRFRAPQPGPRRGRMRGGGRPVRPVGGRWRLLAAGQRVARLRHGLYASTLCTGAPHHARRASGGPNVALCIRAQPVVSARSGADALSPRGVASTLCTGLVGARGNRWRRRR